MKIAEKAISFQLMLDVTMLVEIAGACLELVKLHNLDIKREWAFPCHKERCIILPNPSSSCGKICTMPETCSN
jgi:hypothetical protein